MAVGDHDGPDRPDHPPGYPQGWESTCVLADGATAFVRPVEPDDTDALGELFEGLSDESLYLRFFSPGRNFSDARLRALTTVDYVTDMSFVALSGGELIGAAMYSRSSQLPSEAEVAFTIRDRDHGRGIGTLLLELLAAYASTVGVTRFTAMTLTQNDKMLGVFAGSGWTMTRTLDHGVWELAFDIDERADDAILERERRADVEGVRRALEPGSVAVIGAGRDPDSLGNRILANIVAAQFRGTVFAVNPDATEVCGLPAFPTVAAIGSPVDLAVVVVPAAAVAGVLRECGDAGVRAAVLITAGFAEAGDHGAAGQQELLGVARRYGMRLIGPNCMGVLNTAGDVRLDATFARSRPRPGHIGVLSQSGALGVAMLARFEELGLGLSSFVSVGNKIDLSGNDFLQYWHEDGATEVVALYLESFGNPRKFVRVSERVSRDVPIVAVKGGRTMAGKRAAASHTAAIADDDSLVDELFRRTGVLRVDTLDELYDTVRALASQPVPDGRRLAIVGNSGGPGILAADAAVAAGLDVPVLGEATRARLRDVLPEHAAVDNPVDVAAAGGPAEYAAAIRIVLDSADVDALLVVHTDVTGRTDVVEAIAGAAAGATKPVLATLLSDTAPDAVLRDAGGGREVPVYRSPEAPVRALARIARYGEWRRRPPSGAVEVDGTDRPTARRLVQRVLASSRDGRWLEPAEVAELAAAYGLPLLAQELVHDADGAADAARRLGLPVAVKVNAPAISHRGDLGGVALALRDEEEVRSAYASVASRFAGLMDGVVVQPMSEPGVEMIVGAVNDPEFGPVVGVGMGGAAAALVRDRAIRIAPVGADDAHDAIRSLRTFGLLDGHRGTPRADVEALADVMVRLGLAAKDLPDLAEAVLDPVVARPDGVTVVHARIRLRPAPRLIAPIRRRVR